MLVGLFKNIVRTKFSISLAEKPENYVLCHEPEMGIEPTSSEVNNAYSDDYVTEVSINC